MDVVVSTDLDTAGNIRLYIIRENWQRSLSPETLVILPCIMKEIHCENICNLFGMPTVEIILTEAMEAATP